MFIEEIISKMILDRTCNVCGGIRRYKLTRSASTETIKCKACDGRGYTTDSSSASVLISPDASGIPLGTKMSMESQNISVIDTNNFIHHIEDEIRGRRYRRIYLHNVDMNHYIAKLAISRLQEGPTEIHVYFS